MADGDVRGIAVHLASRVAAIAEAGEILVTRTVRDLVAGSGLRFAEYGVQLLHGIDEEVQLYSVRPK